MFILTVELDYGEFKTIGVFQKWEDMIKYASANTECVLKEKIIHTHHNPEDKCLYYETQNNEIEYFYEEVELNPLPPEPSIDKYQVWVTYTDEESYSIEATSEDEAIEKAKQLFKEDMAGFGYQYDPDRISVEII